MKQFFVHNPNKCPRYFLYISHVWKEQWEHAVRAHPGKPESDSVHLTSCSYEGFRLRVRIFHRPRRIKDLPLTAGLCDHNLREYVRDTERLSETAPRDLHPGRHPRGIVLPGHQGPVRGPLPEMRTRDRKNRDFHETGGLVWVKEHVKSRPYIGNHGCNPDWENIQ